MMSSEAPNGEPLESGNVRRAVSPTCGRRIRLLASTIEPTRPPRPFEIGRFAVRQQGFVVIFAVTSAETSLSEIVCTPSVYE
jgi:hypothetical protein